MTKRDDSTMKKMSERLGNYEIPLTALKDGEAGIIMSISGGGYGRRWGFEKRLADLGLTPGTRIIVVKAAPFHGPIEVLVRGSRLALGRGISDRILVKKEERCGRG